MSNNKKLKNQLTQISIFLTLITTAASPLQASLLSILSSSVATSSGPVATLLKEALPAANQTIAPTAAVEAKKRTAPQANDDKKIPATAAITTNSDAENATIAQIIQPTALTADQLPSSTATKTAVTKPQVDQDDEQSKLRSNFAKDLSRKTELELQAQLQTLNATQMQELATLKALLNSNHKAPTLPIEKD
jgi:hypothetical protein